MSVSITRQIWNVAAEDRRQTGQLAAALGIPRIAAHLLALRGITTPDEGRLFLYPSVDALADPFLLPDLDRAVARIREAGARGERLRIFGDYDVDGIAGTALLVLALRRMGILTCDYAMPSRIAEGYGIAPEHVEAAHRAGVTLLVTVDNGIAARAAAATAQKLGIDLIITDHHPIEGPLPEALAVVNPKRRDSAYPEQNACGTGVAFHLARALTGEAADLDLVALGTIADIVPLRGENRVLAAAGLVHMSRKSRTGLAALAAAADIDLAAVTSEKVAFQLGPRLNAAGRLGDGVLALDLLLTDSRAHADRIARQLNDANDRRRDIERVIFEDAIRQIEAAGTPDQRSIVLASHDWHPGVVGIVAARLQTIYNRPVVLVAIDKDGIGRGSARSTDSFDMAAALCNCRDCLLRFGGHAAAAGLAIAEDCVEKFQARFEEEARKRAAVERAPELNIDALVALSEIDDALVRTLDLLEPYGYMNPAPLFCSTGVNVMPQSVRELQGGHIRMTVKQGPRLFPAIGFRMAPLLGQLQTAAPLDIAFSPKFNTWRGETTIQLVLKDIRTTQ